MVKSCDNCYWHSAIDDEECIKKLKPKDRECEEHTYECECGSEAEYKYEDDFYCTDCMVEQVGIDTYTTTHYMCDGEYLGCDDDLDEVINNIRSCGYVIENIGGE